MLAPRRVPPCLTASVATLNTRMKLTGPLATPPVERTVALWGEYLELSGKRKTMRAVCAMDEPTAALDALAEEKIYREFDSLLRGRTALFISHRLASTRFCDRIVVLDGGRISQAGTHDELLNREGLYREMFLTQGKYYRQDKEDEDEQTEVYSA